MASCQNQHHWFIDEVFKWRSIASAVWTWCMTFPVLAAFTVLLLLQPSRHIFIIYDFVSTVSHLSSWFICMIIATLTGLLVHLHYRYYEVAPLCPINRYRLILRLLKPCNLAYYALTGLYCAIVSHLSIHLVEGRYSHSYHQCSLGVEDSYIDGYCINEAWFILVLFASVLGVVHSVDSIVQHKCRLSYLNVQEARFLYIKCKLPSTILECATKSFATLRHFIVVYYLMGFLVRDAVAFIMGVLPSENHLLSVWRIVCGVSTLWNLWLFGTMLLLLMDLSWQLLNIYNTQNFPFLFDSVFPEDQKKLLVDNLGDSNPPAVQHLAYQCLALMARENPVKRQHIFALSHQTENGRPIWWNKVADNCLSRLRELTKQLGNYQLMLSDGHKLNHSKLSSTSSSGSNDSKSEITIGSASTLHRRPLAAFDATLDATNLSYLNVSSLNATTANSMHATLNTTKATVPTPRLWTAANDTALGRDSVLENTYGEACAPMQLKSQSKKFSNFVNNIKSIPFVAYFISKIHSWCLSNLYRKQMIYKWAMQSISYICAASVAEDHYGVVQTRLHEVLATLLDLLQALEKLGKPAGTSTYVYKIHCSLCNETKASLHRIADSFGDSLKSVTLSHEHRRRIQSLMTYDE